MESPSRESLRQELPCPIDPGTASVQERFGSVAGGRRLLAAFLDALAILGYSERSRMRVREAVGPALLRALRCSWRDNPSVACTFNYAVRDGYVLVEVEGVASGQAGPPLAGPHGSHLLQPAAGAVFCGTRSYTWVRCDRQDDRLSVCGFFSVP